MASYDNSFNTLITCGRITKSTREFDELIQIDHIHEYICRSFHSSLPRPYKIVYYDPMTMSIIDLEDQLRHGQNPFIDLQTVNRISCKIHLFIVHDSSMDSDNRSDNDIQSSQTTSDENLSNSSTNSVTTNDNSPLDYKDPSLTLSETLKTTHFSSNQLFFSLDVKSHQKDIYRSDQFGIREEKNNGHIARVQGVKTFQEKMHSILPRLRIPSMYRQPNVTLLVAVVSERLDHGMRIWYKHDHKGFLPENYDRDTETINPIEFLLTNEGDFTLNLQMITKWNKEQKSDKEFYRLDEDKVALLHLAAHDPHSPRLICVLRQDDQIIWETVCLSDFIRSPKSSKRKYIDQNCSSNRQRSKTAN